MRRWLQGAMSGCMFAPHLAKPHSKAVRYRSLPGLPDERTPALVNAAMDDAAQEGRAIILSFPRLRTGSSVAHLLRTLCQDERWQAKELDGSGATLDVALTWRTPGGKLSRVMGLGALSTMPVTRCAPYVALAAWTGGHENPWRQPKIPRNVVMFSDMPHELTEEHHDRWEHESELLTARMVAQTGDAPPTYKLTFRLEPAVREIIFPA
ncbi:MAG TPA: hypothetical protein VGG39_00420 [Polyangiaceae bacterium]|jgi:hypothetical protein